MKVKKFNNLLTMGLIIFGLLLIGFYVLKIIYPEFIIGIAEIPAVVKFGEFVDSHTWAYYLFTFFTSFITGLIYCCACLRKTRLKLIDVLIVAIEVGMLLVVQKFLPQYYLMLNILLMLIMPVFISLIHKETDIKIMYSTTVVLSIHLLAQMLSLEIRNLTAMVHYPNIATLTILLIDGFIWLAMLYCFYNFKNKRG